MSDLPPDQGSEDVPALAEAPDEEEFTRLVDQVGLSLRLGRVAEAAAAVDELLSGWPESTTASELAGDVALAEGKVAQARQQYKRALELEPANADAERKYGAALLTLTADEQRAALINEIIADPTAHRTSARRPLNAVLNGLIFPGLGQLYNREQEKGLVMVGAGALLLMLLFYLVVLAPYSQMVAQSSRHGLNTQEQLQRSQEALDSMGAGHWLLIGALILLYVALYLYGLYDAWRQGQGETERVLGV